MKIESTSGRCRECGGSLEIVAADEATMTVECQDGHCYSVAPDAFGDACMLYHFGVMVERQEGDSE